MSFRRLPRVLALLAVVLVTAWVFAPGPERSPTVRPPSPNDATPPVTPTTGPTRPDLLPTPPVGGAVSPAHAATRTAPAASAVAVTVPPTPPSTVAVGTPDAATSIAVDQVRLMLRDYRTLMGENPVGTNAEIMKALLGDNPRQATLGPPEGQTLNDRGELVDRWGTPLFFHQLSRNVMEIRSAGADRTMGTADDIVAQ